MVLDPVKVLAFIGIIALVRLLLVLIWAVFDRHLEKAQRDAELNYLTYVLTKQGEVLLEEERKR